MSNELPGMRSLKNAATAMSNASGDVMTWSHMTTKNILTDLETQYNSSQDSLKTYYGKAIDEGQPWAEAGLTAYKSYVSALQPENAQQNLDGFLKSAGVQSVFGKDLSSGEDAFDNYKNSIGYKFQYDQSMKAAQQGASAGGYLNSPEMSMAMQNRGQDLASTTYNNYAQLMQNAYQQYSTQQQSAAQIGLGAMQGQQQLNAGLGADLASLSQQYGSDRGNTQMWNMTNQANARLAQGQAWANYNLVKAGLQMGPANQGMMGQALQANSALGANAMGG